MQAETGTGGGEGVPGARAAALMFLKLNRRIFSDHEK